MALAACSNEGTEMLETGSVSFRVRSKAGAGMPRLTRLYLAERLPEHANKPGVYVEGLHCELDNRHYFEGDTWEATGLFGQWYKFAFVNVPLVPGVEKEELLPDPLKEKPTDLAYLYECDFNKLYVDFSKVIAYQQEAGMHGISAEPDLAIYRKNIDRWVNPSNPTTEDVTLTRVTGELVVDMGIPTDQFEYPVREVILSIPNLAHRVFIHDGTADSVWTAKTEHEHKFSWAVDSQESRQEFRLALLPDTLRGATLTVMFDPDTGVQPREFPLLSDEEEPRPVYIKKNVRTHVLFNGLHTDEFEVRYAGFDNQASVDVEDDSWNGPNYGTDKGEEDNEGGEGNEG
mgnify:CR=1 FL=1